MGIVKKTPKTHFKKKKKVKQIPDPAMVVVFF